MAPTLLFKKLKSAAAADALAAANSDSNEMMFSSIMAPYVAATDTSASTSSSRNDKMKVDEEGPSLTSIRQTAATKEEELNATMDITSDESEFNDSNEEHDNAVGGAGGGDCDNSYEEKEHEVVETEHEDEEEEEDSRYMSVQSFGLLPP